MAHELRRQRATSVAPLSHTPFQHETPVRIFNQYERIADNDQQRLCARYGHIEASSVRKYTDLGGGAGAQRAAAREHGRDEDHLFLLALVIVD